MKYIKTYESVSEKSYHEEFIGKFQIVKCNWCNWFGEEDELLMEDDGETCPKCQNDDYLIDLYFDNDFYVYARDNEPEPNINKDDYNDPYEYYKSLYPLYFNSKKYNL